MVAYGEGDIIKIVQGEMKGMIAQVTNVQLGADVLTCAVINNDVRTRGSALIVVSSVILYNITGMPHKHHTHIYPLLYININIDMP